MIKTVIKRDGTVEPFSEEKIAKVIEAALQETYGDCYNQDTMTKAVLDSVLSHLNSIPESASLPIENIQDYVQRALMERGWFEAASKFIEYRCNHKNARFIRERLDYMNEYSSSNNNAATSSETDSNANITVKNVSNLEAEVYKTTNRPIQRQRMKLKLDSMYPTEGLGKQYIRDLESHIIYTHDEASTPVLKNYCEAVSLYPLLLEGTSTMDGTGTKPPTNLTSFCGQLINLTFLLSAQCKGAVAFGEFFNFFDYFCVKEWGTQYDIKEDLLADSEFCIHKKTIGQKIEQAFQNIIYSWNQPAGNRGCQSPFVNISYYDSNYWHSLFGEFAFPDGTKPEWRRINYLQKKFMKWFNNERTKTLLSFPVETMALLTDGEQVLDKEYLDFTAEMQEEGHSFFVFLSENPNGLASCCRLMNEIDENVFSFTNGLTGVQTGSCNVITLNLNRIVQDFVKIIQNQFVFHNECLASGKELPKNPNLLSMEEIHHYRNEICKLLPRYLTDILERVYKYHIAYKTMLYEQEKAGMITASSAGYISMRKLFSTIGLNGINEAALFLGMTISDNENYCNFCNLITSTIKAENKKHSTPLFKFNTEFVPAEDLGAKNFNWDKEDGYWIPNDRNLYNSYFYDAHDDTSILEKMRLHGKRYTANLDGGVGCHLNLEEHLSKSQYLLLIDYAIAHGLSYFTYNIPNTECDECHFISKQPLTKCPKCGSSKVTQWTRVIGYLRPIKAFSQARYIEANKRTYSNAEIY